MYVIFKKSLSRGYNCWFSLLKIINAMFECIYQIQNINDKKHYMAKASGRYNACDISGGHSAPVMPTDRLRIMQITV